MTTIEDSIFRADGTRFSGIALIEWRSFLTSDLSSVSAYNKSVRIVDGVVKVNLVPTTTASSGAYYFVRYVVNGRVQSTEYWAVRPSSSPLKLKDIQLVGPPLAGSPVSAPPGVTIVQIPDVVGLTDELSARAKKGIGYTPSRVAIINSSGDLDGVQGQPTDCVRANGTVGACGDATAGPTFVDSEVPAGLINGTNTTFTLANAPNPAASLQLYRNGVLLKITLDYTLSGNIITFLSQAVPQSSDILLAAYRLGTSGQPGGQAGGALTGYFPAPSVAPGAIADLHIAPNAAIAESKLALNFPTHSNSTDPSPDQKLALIGTSGNVGNANRYVTDQDPRLSNPRSPSSHALLAGAHMDANPGVVTRGDLIVGQGASPTLWSRLPLGAPNRCLISNGFDAVWNACLYTGFPIGSVPFVDASGNLAHNNSRLFWDNSLRRLGVGTNAPASTLTVYDAAVGTGATTVTVRGGDAQAAEPLQRWQNPAGADLATLDSSGLLSASGVKSASTATRSAWQDSGASSDPSVTSNGDFWYNSTAHSRKTVEAGQTHSTAQVLCSIAASSTSAITASSLGTCRIPAAALRAGDRFDIRVDLSHEGTSTPFSYALLWGATELLSRSGAESESRVVSKLDLVPQGTSLYWDGQSWGSNAWLALVSTMASNLPSGDVIVDVKAQFASLTSDTVTLRNLTIVRLPAQVNP